MSKMIKPLLSYFLLPLLFFSCKAQHDYEKEWIELFNGKDLTGWDIKIRNHDLNENYGNTFRVEDGILKVRYDQYKNFDEQFGHIFYKEPFSAYLLVAEYRFTGDQVAGGPGWAVRNNGLMLHSQSAASMLKDQDFPLSLETQLLGGIGDAPRSTGNLCTPGTNVVINGQLITDHCLSSTSKTYYGDRWVEVETLVLRDSIIYNIIERDTVFTYTKPQVGGGQVSHRDSSYKDGQLLKSGYIALQAESAPTDFRKIALFNLEPYMGNPSQLENALNYLRNRRKK